MPMYDVSVCLDAVFHTGTKYRIIAAGPVNNRLLHVIAGSLGVEFGSLHRQSFIVDEAIVVAVDHRVNPQAEDVLVVYCKYTRVDDCAPRYVNAFVNRLSAEDTRRANLVGDLAGLVENERENVLVIGDSDDRLKDQFSRPDNGCPSCAVITRAVSSWLGSISSIVLRVLPANSGVLLMHADDVGHVNNTSLIVRQHSTEVVDGSKAVASQL